MTAPPQRRRLEIIRSLTAPTIPTAGSISLTSSARAYCEGDGLVPFVDSIAELARASFDLAEPLTFSMSCDPDSGQEWLEVTATARGTVREIRDHYRGFTGRWLASMPATVREHVRLVLLAE